MVNIMGCVNIVLSGRCVLRNILSPFPEDGGNIFLLIVGSAKQDGVVTNSTTVFGNGIVFF
jgi:hypothetical protein